MNSKTIRFKESTAIFILIENTVASLKTKNLKKQMTELSQIMVIDD